MVHNMKSNKKNPSEAPSKMMAVIRIRGEVGLKPKIKDKELLKLMEEIEINQMEEIERMYSMLNKK